ncbi:uncharacterized protein BP5553_04872 [Venustampulla echinocandica]|uniref:Velvet domain-containing protein n=1 Tax=Venustampulla echinocandica TaxID=2656787 RepID=A0A370TPI9_9HELO|nr:uncharacterized protein BP5553_04872 [Venustampulla echinocandica]RDL37439.1 hypothetical protein BP5553_04872 [Venustampulla echinocandica]
MSLSEPPRTSAAPRPPDQRHPYPPPPGDKTRLPRELQTTLPPMSSLLPTHERTGPGPAAQKPPYPPRPFPLEQSNHPLWLSELDPAEPVRHIYHPAQPPPTSHSSFYRAEPFLVPTSPLPDLEAPRRVKTPIPQRRQIRKILQRRPESPKAAALDGGSSSSPPIVSNAPYNIPPPPPTKSQTASKLQNKKQPPHNNPTSTSSESQTSKSMQISGLLSDGPRSAHPPLVCNVQANSVSPRPPSSPPRYTIRMRQQPIAARACGFGERDRRVIDPPPILQMTIEDSTASPDEMRAMLRQPCAVVHCTLWDPVANKDDTAMPGTTDKRQQRRLMGTLVSSPFVGKDEYDVEGCFFTFPDLSVRTPGTYSLRFSLMIIDPQRMRMGHSVPVSWVVYSDPFHVYNAKDFGGMRASTELTKKLKHQGCLISVKKGNAKSSSRDDDDDDDDDDGDEEAEDKNSKRPSKRTKR